jgi:nucleoside-triphosphatase THEP1
MHILVISGALGAGKTSLCMSVFHAAKTRNILCEGCLELSERGDDMVPYRIQLLDLARGTIYLAAERPKNRENIPFTFYPEAFARIRESSIQALGQSTRLKRLCIIDEVGPLELERNRGHFKFLKAILDVTLVDGLVMTVRSSLQEALVSILEKHKISLQNIQLLEIDGHSSATSQGAASFFIETI